MARDERGIIQQIFADTGDVAEPMFDFAEGWPVAYAQAGGQTPEREVFNRLFQRLYALGYDVTRFGGGLPWDNRIDYISQAIVTGSDGRLYEALQASGPNTGGAQDPVDATEFWKAISFSERDPHTFTAPQRYAQAALAIEAGAVVWDCAAAPSAVLLLTGDVTSMTITGYEPGGAYDLTVIQDATGGWSCAMPAAIMWPDGAGYEPSTDPDAVDRIYLAPAVNPADDTVLPLASVEHAYAVVS